LSPVIADIAMNLEIRTLENYVNKIQFYYRYVDDLTAVPRQKVKDLLNKFNSFHPRMQFTIEIGGRELFLNVKIINNGNVLEFDWYKKPTFSVIEFFIQSPLLTKKRNNHEYD